jgi:putative ABC transport system permease protein
MIINALREALRALTRNLMRSFLTMLGIIIGVAAVIVMVTLGEGATQAVTSQIASLGSNLLVVTAGKRMGPGQISGAAPFRSEDAKAIEREITSAAAVAPAASRAATAVFGNQNWVTAVTGTDNAYFLARSWTIAKGRIFTQSELRGGSAVCVIGATVASKLFGPRDPLGERIRVKKISFEVVGVLDTKGQSTMGTDQDDLVIVPLRAFQRRISGKLDVNVIYVSARDGVETGKVSDEIRALLRERRHLAPGEEDDFNVTEMKEIAKMLTSTTQVLTMLLGSVAAVSLLVGGIGIMNIMLVSVTERTREIGIRLAIGALERDVLMQFLVEALLLASLGGCIGLGVAVAGSAALADGLRIPFVFQPGIVVVAFLFSAAVGIVFGYFPARRAAHLDPIEALRRE